MYREIAAFGPSQVYFNDWAQGEESQMCEDFRIMSGALAPYEILLASYTYESYSGDAFVLLRERATQKLFTVEGSHCSCNGLEDQWEPVETSLEALQRRMPLDQTHGPIGWPEILLALAQNKAYAVNPNPV